MATVVEVCSKAMKHLGVLAAGETASADDIQEVLNSLNSMLDSWSTERLYVYALQTDVLTLTGAASYTIGPTDGVTPPTFNTARPVKVDSSSYTLSGTTSYPLRILSETEYLAISDKSVSGTIPDGVYYLPTVPYGTLYFWPLNSATVYLRSWKPLTQYTALTTDVILPPGYQRAIELSLAEEIAPLYGSKVSQELGRLAMRARKNIKRVNSPDLELAFPSALVGRDRFDIVRGW